MAHRHAIGGRRPRSPGSQPPDEALYELCVSQCPHDWFRACFLIWHSVADFRMALPDPVDDPGDTGGAPLHGRLRSAFAVKTFLGEREDLLAPIVNRILAVASLIPSLVDDPRFSPFIQCDDGNAILMSETLIEAFAGAPFVAGTLMYDVEAVYTRTVQIERGAPEVATS